VDGLNEKDVYVEEEVSSTLTRREERKRRD
jgi:hypothetical protein